MSEEENMGRKDKRPELGPVAVGDEMVVVDSVRRGAARVIPAVVARRGPVWVTLVAADHRHLPSRGRFRVNDQREENTAGAPAHFCTPEQRAWDVRDGAARTYLGEIRVEAWNSPRWADDMVTLANLIREHEGLDPL